MSSYYQYRVSIASFNIFGRNDLKLYIISSIIKCLLPIFKKSVYTRKSSAHGEVRRTSSRRDAWRDSVSAESVSVGAL